MERSPRLIVIGVNRPAVLHRMEEPTGLEVAHRYPLPLYWGYCSGGLSCHSNKAGASMYRGQGRVCGGWITQWTSERVRMLLWSQITLPVGSSQLHRGPFLLAACHSMPHYSASHDLLSYVRAAQHGRHTASRGISATKRCFHIPLAELVSSLAPNEGVFVEMRGGLVFCKGELLL